MSETSTGPLRHRDFAWFWSGQTASIAGNGIFRIALPLEVLHLTGNPFDLALVLALDQFPLVLFVLVGGALVDRLSRRLIMLVSDIANGLATVGIGVLIATGHARLWQFLLLAVVSGVATAVYLPASSAIIPDILPAPLLTAGNSLMSLSQSLGQFLLGPLAGGVIVALAGTDWAFGLDGLSFLISAGCLVMVRNVARGQPSEETSVIEEVLAGLRYSRSRRWLWWNMVAVGIANLAAYLPLFVVLPLLVKDVFKSGSLALGVVYAASGVGGALASMYLKRRGAPDRRIPAMWLAMAVGSLSVCLLGAAPVLWVGVVFAGTLWAGVTYANIVWFSTIQERVPSELLGRIMSLDLLMSVAMGPLGFFLGGIGSNWFGARTTLIVGGAIALSTTVVAFVPGVLRPDEVQPQPDLPAELTT